mmetsp:Transcript_4576/g.6564  ORF Transcript_4576/g.6564 Transcript_4576/m.6564 type:complete len:514 (-) Transcript_4576:451-1992(-)
MRAMTTVFSPRFWQTLVSLTFLSLFHRHGTSAASHVATNVCSIGMRSAMCHMKRHPILGGFTKSDGVGSPCAKNRGSRTQRDVQITTTSSVSGNNRELQREPDVLLASANAGPVDSSHSENKRVPSGGAQASAAAAIKTSLAPRPLRFWENMVCGAVSRSVAQTVMHPANTMKTILQANRDTGATESFFSLCKPSNFKLLTRGAGAQFILSVPHGAVNFAVLEYVRRQLTSVVENRMVAVAAAADREEGNVKNVSNKKRRGKNKAVAAVGGPGLDFFSSAISTICCSVVSTPQMMITDNIMAGTYANLPTAVTGLMKDRGLAGFYSGWWPGLAGKIPSYGLTWALFQELKETRTRIMKRPAKDIENSIMGCLASATTVTLMIPMDTIKTRLVTQVHYPDLVPYKGIVDCAIRVAREEGVGSFYRGLAPRLISVVPMIGIQFGVYEFMKKAMESRNAPTAMTDTELMTESQSAQDVFEEISMEVAADDDQPFPAPYFRKRNFRSQKNGKKGNAL